MFVQYRCVCVLIYLCVCGRAHAHIQKPEVNIIGYAGWPGIPGIHLSLPLSTEIISTQHLTWLFTDLFVLRLNLGSCAGNLPAPKEESLLYHWPPQVLRLAYYRSLKEIMYKWRRGPLSASMRSFPCFSIAGGGGCVNKGLFKNQLLACGFAVSRLSCCA